MRYTILLTIGLFFIAGCGDAPRLGPDDNSDFGQISGQVISPYNEQGVSNVVLYTIPSTTQAVTDTHGFFLLDSIPAGDYVVMIADTLLILQDYIWVKDSALVTVDDYDSIDCGILHIVRGVGWEFEDVSVGTMPYGPWIADNGSWGVANNSEAPSGTRVLVGETGGAPDTLATLEVPTGSRVSYGFFTHFCIPTDTMGVYGPRSRVSLGVRYNRDSLSMYSLNINVDRITLVRNLPGEQEMIATSEYSIAIGEWHTILISLQGDYISYQIDGYEFPAVFDNELRTGGSTVVSVNRIRYCAFDDMMVLY